MGPCELKSNCASGTGCTLGILPTPKDVAIMINGHKGCNAHESGMYIEIETRLYWGYIGIMEKKMETTII